jgi:hypothetical protein
MVKKLPFASKSGYDDGPHYCPNQYCSRKFETFKAVQMHLHHNAECFKFCITDMKSIWQEPNEIRKKQKIQNNVNQGKTTGLESPAKANMDEANDDNDDF